MNEGVKTRKGKEQTAISSEREKRGRGDEGNERETEEAYLTVAGKTIKTATATTTDRREKLKKDKGEKVRVRGMKAAYGVEGRTDRKGVWMLPGYCV